MEKQYMSQQIIDAVITATTYHWIEHPKEVVCSHNLKDFDVIYTKSGSYDVIINDKYYLSQAGDVIIVPPGSSMTVTSRELAQQFFCHFSLASTEHIELGASFGEHLLPKTSQDMVPVYARIVGEFGDKQPSAYFILLLKLFLLNMVEVYEQNSIMFLNEPHKYLPSEVLSAVKYIQEHASENVTTEQLAGLTGFNTAYFSRYFKKYMGISPVRYSTNYRLNLARHLVVSTNRSFKEIASLTGFVDQFAFSKRFKEYYGSSPTELRKVKV